MNCIQLLLDFSQDRTGQAQLCNKLFPFYFSLFHINYTSYYFIYYVVSYHIISCMKSQSSASMKSRQASLSLLDIALFSRFCITFYDSPKWPTEIQLKQIVYVFTYILFSFLDKSISLLCTNFFFWLYGDQFLGKLLVRLNLLIMTVQRQRD